MGIVIKLNFKHSRFFYEHEDMPINILKRCWVLSKKVFSRAATSQGFLLKCNIPNVQFPKQQLPNAWFPLQLVAPQNLPLGKLTVR